MKYTTEPESSKPDKELLNDMYIKFDQYEVPEFAVKLRGYDRTEVDHYLNALVDAYNQMYEEHETLKAELDEYRRKKDAIAEALIEAKITAGGIINEARGQNKDIAPDFEVIRPEQKLLPDSNGPAHPVRDRLTYEGNDVDRLLEKIIAESGG